MDESVAQPIEDLSSTIGSSNLRDPTGVAVDWDKEKIYWTDWKGNDDGAIYKSDLGLEYFIKIQFNLWFLFLYIYLDGQNFETFINEDLGFEILILMMILWFILSSIGDPSGLVLLLDTREYLVADSSKGKIFRFEIVLNIDYNLNISNIDCDIFYYLFGRGYLEDDILFIDDESNSLTKSGEQNMTTWVLI